MAQRTIIDKQAESITVIEVLAENSEGLTPEMLFSACSRDATQIEEIEQFFSEIRDLLESNQIEEIRKNSSTVILKTKS